MLAVLIAVTTVTVPVSIIAYISGSLMPLLTGLVTHVKAAAPLKAGLNLVLSLAAGVVAAFAAHQGTLELNQIVDAAIKAYLASGIAYLAFWKPTGIAPAVNAKGLAIGAPPPGG